MVLKRPHGLERLADYASKSNIPPIFLEAVTTLWPNVHSSTSSEGSSGSFHKEIAARLFRSTGPFDQELLADYALSLGMSIALAKSLTTDRNPEAIMAAINQPNTFEQHQLRNSIYPHWGHATLCELQATPDYYSLTRSPLHKLRVVTGLAPNTTHLAKVLPFMDDYYADPSHIRDLLFLSGKV